MKCKFHRPTSITHLVMCNTKKNKNLFGFSYYGQKQRVHNMLQQQCTNSAQLSYREGTQTRNINFLINPGVIVQNCTHSYKIIFISK